MSGVNKELVALLLVVVVLLLVAVEIGVITKADGAEDMRALETLDLVSGGVVLKADLVLVPFSVTVPAPGQLPGWQPLL